MATQAGDVELKIPKLRRGSFFPSVLEPRRHIDRALWAVIMEAYVAGVSTRSVDDLVAEQERSRACSESEVSRICAGLDETVEAFRSRLAGRGVAGAQLDRHHLAAVGGSQHRVEPEPALEVRRRALLVPRMHLHQRRIDVEHHRV